MAHTDAYLLCLSRKAAVFCKEALIDLDCTGKENKITLRVTKCRKTRHIFCSMFLLDCWHLYVSQLWTRSKDIRHVRVQISVMPVFCVPACTCVHHDMWNHLTVQMKRTTFDDYSSSCRDTTELINGFSARYYPTCLQQTVLLLSWILDDLSFITALYWAWNDLVLNSSPDCVLLLLLISPWWKQVEWNVSFTTLEILSFFSIFSINDAKWHKVPFPGGVDLRRLHYKVLLISPCN